MKNHQQPAEAAPISSGRFALGEPVVVEIYAELPSADHDTAWRYVGIKATGIVMPQPDISAPQLAGLTNILPHESCPHYLANATVRIGDAPYRNAGPRLFSEDPFIEQHEAQDTTYSFKLRYFIRSMLTE